jgi:hypothetical protein
VRGAQNDTLDPAKATGAAAAQTAKRLYVRPEIIDFLEPVTVFGSQPSGCTGDPDTDPCGCPGSNNC